MDGSVGTRKDKTLNIPELFEASGLQLPLLLGQVLSTQENRRVTQSREEEGQCDGLQSSLQLLRSFQP